MEKVASLRTAALAFAFLGLVLLAACATSSGSEPPETPAVTPTPIREDPTPTPTVEPTEEPTPTPTKEPEPEDHLGLIVGGTVYAYAEPSSQSEVVRTYAQGDLIRIVRRVNGENWIVGEQDWEIAWQFWHDHWLEIEGGGYVYTAWVFEPRPGDALPWELPEGERWVDVNTSTQTLTFYVNDTPVYTAPVTTGKPGYESPPGTHYVYDWGRIVNTPMTSANAGYPEDEQYEVERVLFTQYFTGVGDALHLNYWRPQEWFGSIPSSHGCVGLWLHDAQWLWLAGHAGMRVEIHA